MTDDELIAELKKRFDHTKQTLYDLKILTKKLEEVNKKLESSEKVKSNFVSHMKNEINNPLTSILGLAQQLVAHAGMDPASVAAVATSIHDEAFSLDFQLRNIFAAAEMESGETSPQVSIVDVDNLVQDAIGSFQHLITAKKLTLNFKRIGSPKEPLRFKTDAEKLSLVVNNLLSNAVEFNNPEGNITIKAGVVDGQLNLSVADTGVGLESSQVNQIFDRFKQLESGTTKSHKGHGLGLSITKAVIDLMEGTISVSTTLDKGCTFTIAIPEIETDVEADAFSVDGNEFFFDDDDGSEVF